MTKAFDKIMAGLKDVESYLQGNREGFVVHVFPSPPSPPPDVASIRKAMKLSRPKFAERFGLDARAIQDWEQGRRMPDRAARVLLQVIARHPDVVAETVRITSPSVTAG